MVYECPVIVYNRSNAFKAAVDTPHDSTRAIRLIWLPLPRYAFSNQVEAQSPKHITDKRVRSGIMPCLI